MFCGRLIVATRKDKYLWLALDPATFGSGEGLSSWLWDEEGLRPDDAGEASWPTYKRPPSRNGYYDPTKDPLGRELERIQHAHLAYIETVLARGRAPDHRSKSTPGLLETVLSWATREETEDTFTRAVRVSRASSAESRRARLLVAPRIPEARTTTVTVYERNPDVVAEALLRAAGVCELCHAPAPFIRASDGTPYLEVHHRRRLADQGEDTLENAVACCPNCHRRAHLG